MTTTPASSSENMASVLDAYQSPFHVVTQARAHELVVDQIVFAVRSGIFKPGERLPSIEDLAAQTEVSKPVIGDAVQVLNGYGVLETKRGVKGGITVTNDDIPPQLMWISCDQEDATLTELVEARHPNEQHLAVLALERANEHDINEMSRSLELLEEALADDRSGSFLRYDHLFHYRVGLAARSRVLMSFQHRILCGIAAILSQYDLYHEDPELVLDTHRAILAGLRDRNEEALNRALEAHWRTSSGAFADLEDLSLDQTHGQVTGAHIRTGRL